MTFAGNTPLVGTTIAGKYRLVRRLGVGGMGDVYLARVEGLAGFEKHVAVKLLHEHLAFEPMVMESFLAEARLAANLSHANIAQLYDLGQSDGQFYIAMEYVSGLDLRGLMAEAAKREERLPLPLCCHVLARLCDGLDHAHRKRDASGRPLKLVHRDISPSNCLISFSGEVKLIDFGIAKAAGEDSRTQTGMIKGKTAYLSPEQVQGLSLDRRSDLFSVGIVLYELLCGPRPFAGESDLSVMEAIRDVRYLPPVELDPDLPPELGGIVSRALAKDPQARYQWASEISTDLDKHLFARGELLSARDVGEFVRGLMGGTSAVQQAEGLAPDPEPQTISTRPLKSRSRIRPPPARARATPAGATSAPEPPSLTTDVGPPPEPPTDMGSSRASPPAPPLEVSVASAASSAVTLPAAPARGLLRVAVVLIAFTIAGAAGYAWHPRNRAEPPEPPTPEPVAAAVPAPAPAPPLPPPAPVEVPAAPPEAAPAPAPISAPVPAPAADTAKPASRQTTAAAVKAPPPVPRPPPAIPKPARPPPAAKTDSAYLNLRSNRSAEIVIDGKSIGRSPQLRYALPPGRHEVRFDCVYDWGKAKGEVQSFYLVPYAEGDVTHECLEVARP